MTKINLNIPTFLPHCPICGETLEDCGFPLPAKGKGYCSQGGGWYDFVVEVDATKVVKDKNGKLSKASKWKLTGDDAHKS